MYCFVYSSSFVDLSLYYGGLTPQYEEYNAASNMQQICFIFYDYTPWLYFISF